MSAVGSSEVLQADQADSLRAGNTSRQNFGVAVKDRRTEITVETYEVLIISCQGRLSRSWCESCGKQVALIDLNDACLSGLSIEAIQRQVETGRIHLIGRVGGPSLICLNSLIQI